MEMEMTDDLFHVSFGIMRQVFKDLPSPWGQQKHSNSQIWASETVCLPEVASKLLDGVVMKQRFHGDGDHC